MVDIEDGNMICLQGLVGLNNVLLYVLGFSFYHAHNSFEKVNKFNKMLENKVDNVGWISYQLFR